MSQLKIYTKRKVDSKRKNLEHKCVKLWDLGRDLFCLSREVTT